MDEYREQLIELIRDCSKMHSQNMENWILGGKIGERPSLIGSIADNILAADVAPVAHGIWIEHEFEDEPCYGTEYECSACRKYTYDNTNYCPNCGAKMDGGKNDAAD